MKNLSIIIPFLNEGDEPINTINSIYETANKEEFEIILIDDGSTDNEDLNRFDKFEEVIYIRNETRKGTGNSIEMGLQKSSCPYVLIIDAHMRFLNDNWLNKIVNVLKEEPETLLCTISIAITYENKNEWDINKPLKETKAHHSGADILPYHKVNENGKVLLDPRWRPLEKEKGELYDIPCVMGACYAASTKWFEYIHGFKGLKQWGGIEEFSSLKTWLAGGSVKLLTNTGIGHIYRNGHKVPYNMDLDYVLFNKLWIIYTLFNDKLVYEMFNFIEDDYRYKIPLKILSENIVEAKKEKEYYKKIFTRDVEFLKTIGIEFDKTKVNKHHELKFKIKGLKDAIKLNKHTLSNYEKMLEDLKTNNKINDLKKMQIKEQIINQSIPEINEIIEKFNNRINNLKIEIDKLKPNKSIFGHD